MWFISKYVDNKNKEAWAAQSGINQTILEMQSKINQRLDLYFHEVELINKIIRKLEAKFKKEKK